MDITIGLLAFLLLSGGHPAPSLPLTEASAEAAEVAKVALVRSKEETAYTVKLTAYNAVPEQTDHNPSVTASGALSNPEVVIARSHDLATELPFGTIIAIERPDYQHPRKCGFDSVSHLLGYRVIADTTHSRKVNQLDILLNQEDTVPVGGREVNPAKALGICDGVSVRVVGYIDINDIPNTQAELALAVEGTKLVMAE